MPVVTFAPYAVPQFLDNDGRPIRGGTLETYLAGTSTPAATYADSAGETPNPTAIQLDTAGRPSNGGALVDVRLDVSKSYKFVLKDALGTTVRTVDGVNGGPPAGSVGSVALAEGAVTTLALADGAVTAPNLTNDPAGLEAIVAKLLFTSSLAGAVSQPLSSILEYIATPQRWGAKGDGATDDTAAIQAAMTRCATSGTMLDLAGKSYRVTAKLNVAANLRMRNGAIIVDHPGVGIGQATAGGGANVIARCWFENITLKANQNAAIGWDCATFQYCQWVNCFVGTNGSDNDAPVFTRAWKMHNVSYWNTFYSPEIERATYGWDLNDANDTRFFMPRFVAFGGSIQNAVIFSGPCSGTDWFGPSFEGPFNGAAVGFHPNCEQNRFFGGRIERRVPGVGEIAVKLNGALGNEFWGTYILGGWTQAFDNTAGNLVQYFGLSGNRAGVFDMGNGVLFVPKNTANADTAGGMNYNTARDQFTGYASGARDFAMTPASQTHNMNGHAVTGASAITPAGDGSAPCGGASNRFNAFYATTGTIQTSDEREKGWRGPLTAAELAAAREISQAIGIYQWLSAIAEKGEEGARLHVGVRAQQVASTMESHGLDPARYGFFCYDEWDEHTEFVGDAERTVPAGNRYSIRPDELLFFIAAALEQRLAALEL